MASKDIDYKKSKRATRDNKASTRRPSAKTTSLAKAATVKTAEELQELKRLSAMAIGKRLSVGACWFGFSGGRDQCVPLTEEDCLKQGGVWVGGACVG